MRSPLAPILTILLALASVLAVNVRIQRRQESSSALPGASSTPGLESSRSPSSSPPVETHTPPATTASTSSSISSPSPSPPPPPTTSSSSTGTSSTPDLPPTSSSTVQTSNSLPVSTSSSSTTTIPSNTPASSSSESTLSVTSTPTSLSTQAAATPATTLSFLNPSSISSQDSTVTAIVADPGSTSSAASGNASSNAFFSNTGAVAGTFVVVGLFMTGIFFCVFFWARRKYRHRRNRQIYEDEYWQFNRSAERGTTPEPTLPAMHGSLPSTPALPSPPINMVERSYGDEIPPTHPYYTNTLSIPIQAEPGEFNPYNPQDAAYAFTTSDLHIQDSSRPLYGYPPSQEGHRTPEHPYATALYRRPSSSQSFHRDGSNGQTGAAY